jgi:O-antigen/teichoic acid export membrane protein
VIAASFLLGLSGELKLLVAVSGLTMIFDSLHLIFYAVLRGLKDLRFEAIGIVGSQFVTLVLGGIALYFKLPIFTLIFSFTFASFLNVIFSSLCLRRNYNILPVPKVNFMEIKNLVKIASAFGLAGIFSRIFSSADSIILGYIAGTQALGLYSVPNKISFAFQFIPMSLVAAVFPAMSSSFKEDKKRVGCF